MIYIFRSGLLQVFFFSLFFFFFLRGGRRSGMGNGMDSLDKMYITPTHNHDLTKRGPTMPTKENGKL